MGILLGCTEARCLHGTERGGRLTELLVQPSVQGLKAPSLGRREVVG